jgi:pimeloyl-ACP methyl ester carboxylesterase
MPIAANLYYYAHPGEEARPPVVLIHGAGGTHLYWPPEVRRLARYRIYALDLSGHGKSGGAGNQSISDYARAVLDWLSAVELHQAVFVGHSMGSAIALSLALETPEHVLGLGLLGAGARLRVHPDILQNCASGTTYQTAIDLVVNCSFGPQADPHLVQLAKIRMAETRASVLHGDFLACDAFDLIDRVEEIQRPTLVICGEEDQLTPVRYAQFLANKIPEARLATVPAAGHMVMLEQPQAVAAALKSFLDEIPY